jgi:hypothetical protein
MNDVSRIAQIPTSAWAEAVLLLSLGVKFVASNLRALSPLRQRVKPDQHDQSVSNFISHHPHTSHSAHFSGWNPSSNSAVPWKHSPDGDRFNFALSSAKPNQRCKSQFVTHLAAIRKIMLYTIAVILLVLWLLGLVTGTSMGGLVHILIVVAVILVLVNLLSGRKRL